MAIDTDLSLRNQVMYSVFVRNHTAEGTLAALEADLPRIRDLGVDIVWLMPIHPIGELHRKGTVGSPYANRDYRAVNPDLGTEEDLAHLVGEAHELGMRVIIDVVYNHTSPDSVLFREHPEWFWKRPDGRPGNRVGEWTDVIDLDWTQPGLWDYSVETLCHWASIVDGFRCDVAPMVPVAFWKRARKAVAKVRPDAIWLAESVHRPFRAFLNRAGIGCASDGELYEAFDIEYAYDTQRDFEAFLAGEQTLGRYLDLLDLQDDDCPARYVKLRYLENHDLDRISAHLADRPTRPAIRLEAITALSFFLKGTALLFSGQETGTAHRPELFERDPVDWSAGCALSALITRLSAIRHEHFEAEDAVSAWADDERDIAVMVRQGADRRLVAVLPLSGDEGPVSLLMAGPGGETESEAERLLADGTYPELIGGGEVTVRDGLVETEGQPLILLA